MNGRLSEKSVVITGAAGGIGRAIADRFAQEGARMVLADRFFKTVTQLASDIQRSGGTAAAVEIDVTEPNAGTNLIEQAVENLGRVDIVINNAGVLEVSTILDVETSEWSRVLGVNTLGMFSCLQAAARHMITTNSPGTIINIASVIGRTGHPYLVTYGASKAAMINITRSAAAALAPHNIRVNAVCPGIIGTAMWDVADSRYAEIENLPVGEPRRRRVDKVPLGREGRPRDVAGVVTFLASEDAAYVTGQAINVCGGTYFA